MRTSVGNHHLSDHWALTAVAIVLALNLAFAAWCLTLGGWASATSFLIEQVFGWAVGFLFVALVFAVLLLILRAWPGSGPLWRSALVLDVLSAVPSNITSAYDEFRFLKNLGCCSGSGLAHYLLTNSWPELVAFDLVGLAILVWVAYTYFPAVRGRRLAAFLVVSAVLLLATPVSLPH